jgi:hypothetical protein
MHRAPVLGKGSYSQDLDGRGPRCRHRVDYERGRHAT